MVDSFSLMLMSCTFIFILLIYFLNKEHIKTLELRLYKYLLLSNIIGLVLEMLCSVTIRYLLPYSSFTIIINRLYLLYFIVFATIFLFYISLVSIGKDKYKHYSKKIGKYDLILLDEELSQISGIDLMKKIKALRNFKTPVLLLTKDNSYEYNEEYLKIGFSDYILKPLKKETLLTKINEYTKKDKK